MRAAAEVCLGFSFGFATCSSFSFFSRSSLTLTLTLTLTLIRGLQLVLLLLQIFPEMCTFGLPVLHLFLRHGMVSDAANEG